MCGLGDSVRLFFFIEVTLLHKLVELVRTGITNQKPSEKQMYVSEQQKFHTENHHRNAD